MTTIRTMIIAVLLIGLVPHAWAHRQPEVMTTVEYTGEGKSAETQITHRIHAHDALQLLSQIGGETRRDIDYPQNLARLAFYVEERFAMDGELKTLGAEVDGNFLYVYQLGAGHQAVKGANILADFDPAWSNFINVKHEDGTITSYHFSQVDGETVADQLGDD